MAIRTTPAQLALLRIIDRYALDGDGWSELTLQYECARDLPPHLAFATVERVAEALRRKGLLAADGSPALTDAGHAMLPTPTPEP